MGMGGKMYLDPTLWILREDAVRLYLDDNESVLFYSLGFNPRKLFGIAASHLAVISVLYLKLKRKASMAETEGDGAILKLKA